QLVFDGLSVAARERAVKSARAGQQHRNCSSLMISRIILRHRGSPLFTGDHRGNWTFAPPALVLPPSSGENFWWTLPASVGACPDTSVVSSTIASRQRPGACGSGPA